MEELLIINGEIVGKKNHLRNIHVRNLEDVAVNNVVIVRKSRERCDPYCRTISSWYEILLKENDTAKVFILDKEQDDSSYLKIDSIIADRRNKGILYLHIWKWDSDRKEIIRYNLKDKRGEKVADTDLQTKLYPGNVLIYVKDRKVRTLDGRVLYEIPEGWRLEYNFGYVHYIDPKNYAICTVKKNEFVSKVIWNKDGTLEEILLNTVCTELRILGNTLVVKGSTIEFMDEFGSIGYSTVYLISKDIVQIMSEVGFGKILTRREYEFIREILDLSIKEEEEIKLSY